jgi:hypothetical protein
VAAQQVTTTSRKLLLNAPVIKSNVADPGSVKPPKVFMTFYDAHKDGMLATDVSNKAQAAARHSNFAHQLGTLNPSSFPEIYIVRGRQAPRQLMVLGSEPGENNYSPLWLETNVRWKLGVKPIVRATTRSTRATRRARSSRRDEHRPRTARDRAP